MPRTTRESPACKHYPKTVVMKAKMAMTYANSKRNSYPHRYTSQLNTNCLYLRKMLDGVIESTIPEVIAETDSIVDQCVWAEDHM